MDTVTAVVPHSDELLSFGSAGIFVLKYPGHAVTELLKRVAVRLSP